VRALAAAALALALAAGAQPTAAVGAGDVVAQRTAVVGPALAGDVVVWGEEGRTGAVRVMSGAPGREPRLVHRIAPATAPRTERQLGEVASSFGASSTTFAALAFTTTVIQESHDTVTSSSTNVLVGGPLRGPARILGGCLPARGGMGCKDACGSPDGVDVDGERIAVIETGRPCGRLEEFRTSVKVDGVTVATAPPNAVGVVELAGRYVAWFGLDESFDDELVVRDLETGSDALRLTAAAVGVRGFDELALQPDGTVAFTGGLRRGPGQRLFWTAPGRPGVRLLDRRAGHGDIALSGRRILYERLLSERRFTGELILRPLAGGRERKLAHFPERRRRVGDLDLDAARATWADRPTRRGYDPLPRGPGRVVIRGL
jgi:hypothetical protein